MATSPGQWRVGSVSKTFVDTVHIVDATGTPIAMTNTEDAALVAAAPELRDALEWAIHVIGDMYEWGVPPEDMGISSSTELFERIRAARALLDRLPKAEPVPPDERQPDEDLHGYFVRMGDRLCDRCKHLLATPTEKLEYGCVHCMKGG